MIGCLLHCHKGCPDVHAMNIMCPGTLTPIKYVGFCVTSGLGPVAENLRVVPYDLVSYLVKVKDLKIMS